MGCISGRPHYGAKGARDAPLGGSLRARPAAPRRGSGLKRCSTVRVTVSAGAAAYPNQNVEHDDDLIRLADEALYRAKEAGRNRLEMVA